MNPSRLKVAGKNKTQEISQTEVTKLIERASGGDFEAFGELYGIYLDRIYRYVFYQLREKMAAEDLTEEIFLKAWRAIGSYKGKGQAFSSWLYRIAHNHVIDEFRSRRKQMVSLEAEMEIATEVAEPQQEMERGLAEQEMLRLISCLPQEQKQIIILKFVEGLDNREIGQITGKSQGAIRISQMRALTALRQRLGRENQGNES
jgi:RNA polymerase sigma-70 factor (ECF subfamily)